MSRFYPLLLALLLAARAGRAQTIHTDAAEAYWRLTDALRRDEPLTDAAWQIFINIPANKAYVGSIWGSDTASLAVYRRAIEVVYRPRYDSLRQARVKAGRWYSVLVNDYREHEPQYRAFLTETARNPAYLDKMYSLAYEFLPARNHTHPADLNLSYVAIGNDATVQAGKIIFSLRASRDMNAIRPGILEAHEMHHRLRSSKDFGAIDPTDTPLLGALDMAQNEGLADLTDKRVILTQAPDTADSNDIRRRLLRPAPAVMHQIDSTIQVLAAGGPAAPLKFYRRLTNGSNGHLPGFFMAYTILQNGYRKPLLDHADDPIAFALLYQKAAKKDKLRQHPPTFAPASVRYLQALQRKYNKPQPTKTNG